jgi:hypothetical protein
MGLAVAEHARPKRARRAVDVVARDRPRDAHSLHLTGLDWTSIAAQTGYASGRVAKLAVDVFLEKIAIEVAPEHRRQAFQLELDRLDALQPAFWTTAVEGDRHAADVVLKVIARRCKVLGFDKPDETTAPAPRPVVISGNTDDYIAGLQALIAETEPPRGR